MTDGRVKKKIYCYYYAFTYLLTYQVMKFWCRWKQTTVDLELLVCSFKHGQYLLSNTIVSNLTCSWCSVALMCYRDLLWQCLSIPQRLLVLWRHNPVEWYIVWWRCRGDSHGWTTITHV